MHLRFSAGTVISLIIFRKLFWMRIGSKQSAQRLYDSTGKSQTCFEQLPRSMLHLLFDLNNTTTVDK